MKFKQWIEVFDREKEAEKVSGLNMTRGLPFPLSSAENGADIFNRIAELTRGFHLNTIIGRILSHWTTGFAPIRHDLAKDQNAYDQEDLEKVYQWCRGKDKIIERFFRKRDDVNKDDYLPNDRFNAAYQMFKQEIANAVDRLPYKEGMNINTQNYQDVLLPAKQFFADVHPEGKGLIESMDSAFAIYKQVFGIQQHKQGVRDFLNFFEIVYDEFMKISEVLPAMGQDDESLNFKDSPMAQAIQKEVKKYEKILYGR